MSTESKNDIFDKEINALFTNAKAIIKAKDATKLKLNTNQVNPILKCLNKYIKAYELSEPDDHKEYFYNIFKKYRVPIMKGYKNDAWIKKNTIILQFGEGLENVNPDIKIMLSSIYNMACQLRQDAEKNLDGLPDEAYENCQELIFPDIFMLHLYRLFRESLPSGNEDLSKLNTVINDIENELGITKDESIQTGQEGGSGGFGGLLNLITGILPKFGITPPEGSKLPSEKELTNVFNQLINNKETQNTISNVISSLSECQDGSQVVNKLLSSLGDSKLTEVITNTVESTVSNAIDQNNNESTNDNEVQNNDISNSEVLNNTD